MNSILEKYKKLPIQVKASLWFVVCSFLQKGISVITTPIFTRLLSTSEYGQYGVFNSWLSIITVFVTLNMYLGMYTRGLVRLGEKNRDFSSSLQGLCLTLVVVWTVVYIAFHSVINKVTSLTTPQMLAMLLMIWTSSAFSFWAAEQRVELHYKALVLVTLVTSILKPAIGIILVINTDDKVTARIIGLALVEVIMYTGCFVVQMRRGKKFYSKEYWKEALVFNIPLIPHYLSMSVLNGADKIMIERMVGASEAGIYSLAYSLSQIMKLFNTALSQTIEPWLYKQIKKGDLQGIGRVAYPSWLLIAVLNLLLIALAPEAVKLFAPQSYYNAIWVIPPVAMSVFFIFLYAFFAVFEFYFAKTKLVAVATCAGAVLNIILNYIFIKIFGYYAAGYTTLVCYIVYALMHYFFMVKICKEELNTTSIYNVKILLGMSIVFMVLATLLMITYNYPIIRYSSLGLFVVLIIIYRNRIKTFITSLLAVRKFK